jgi:hypothetical protein
MCGRPRIFWPREREMLLRVVPEKGQDVLLEDIHYYNDPPFDDGKRHHLRQYLNDLQLDAAADLEDI